MDQSQCLEIVDDYAVFRPSGEASVEQAEDMIASAIAAARKQAIPKLLVVTLGWTRLRSPSIPDRYFMVRKWAKAAAGVVKVAVVARPELLDPQKFGVAVATNSGLCAEVFTAEDEAIVWLEGGKDPGRRSAA